MEYIQTNNTWTQIVLPLSKDGIPWKVLLQQKLGDQGHILRYKVRLVAMGSIEKDCVDFDQTFAPVIPLDVLLLIVENFASVGWRVLQADIFTAFLNGEMDNELYILRENKCYKLQKSLYGLNQSPHL